MELYILIALQNGVAALNFDQISIRIARCFSGWFCASEEDSRIGINIYYSLECTIMFVYRRRRCELARRSCSMRALLKKRRSFG